jgi:hypothetical protein
MRTSPWLTLALLSLVVGGEAAVAQKQPAVALLSVDAAGNVGGDLDEPAGDPQAFVTVDITGVESWDLLGDPSNTVLTEFVGEGNAMTGLGWDLTITTVGASWLSEAMIYFDGQDLDGSGLFLTPGVGFGQPGSMQFSSGGILDLTDNGIPNIPIGDDDRLYLEFFESFDDVSDAADAFYSPNASGTPTISRLDLALLFPPPSSEFGPAIPTLDPVSLIVLSVLLAAAGASLLGRRSAAR